MKHDAESTEGFTLLETLVAFLVLTIALAAAIQSLSQTAMFETRAQLNEELRSTSRILLAELEHTTVPPTQRDGVIGDQWTWRWSVAPLQSERNANLLRYVLEVRAVENPKSEITLIGVTSSDAPPVR